MKFMFQNKSSETFPAYGCGRLNSILSTDDATGNPVFELVKPDGADGIYVINGPNNIVVDDLGVAFSLNEATVVLIDDGSTATAPTFGETCGPTDSRWAATTTGTGLIATGALNNRTIPVDAVSTAGGASTDSCPCVCLPAGDIIVNGVETTSVWSIRMGTETFRQTYGSIVFPAGTYTITWDEGLGYWTLDIGDYLTAVYTSGDDATADTTMDGTLTMEWDGYGNPEVRLCVDGEVPEQV